MPALRRSPRQVLVTDKQLHGTERIGELLRAGQRLAYQTGHALAQRVVAALDGMGLTREMVDRAVLRGGNHALGDHRLIGIQHGVLTRGEKNPCPQALGTPVAVVTHRKGDHLATRGMHGDPDPLQGVAS